MKNVNVKDAVFALLDQLAAEGREVPPLRVIRARIGDVGSFGTISDAVKEWRVGRMQADGTLPSGFDAKSGKAILESVWQAVLPVMQGSIEEIQDAADVRVEIERSEAKKMADAAAETIAEGERVKAELAATQASEQQARGELEHVKGALEEAQARLAALQQEVDGLRRERDAAVAKAAAATARAEIIEKLVPFIDPKHMPKQPQK